ncbi:MAG: hypothetical protein IJL62_05725 [Clostridia bacterium]|nr:hypothetical protein [Clostridia bacterium]
MKIKFFRRILVTALCLLTLTVMFMPSASAAANVCRQISGSSKKAVTFTVKTGSRWLLSDKLTIKQTKGVFKYNDWLYREKTAKGYDEYIIKVTKVGGKTKTYTLGGGSITIKLDKNSTYKITVTPADSQTLAWKYLRYGAFDKWTKYPTWKVTSTKGVITCG